MPSLEIQKILNENEIKALEKFAQVIPVSLMQEIEAAAKAKNISVELETLSRFLATFIEPKELGLQSNAEKILKRGFSADDAVAECKRHRQNWLYVYEIEKLKLFLTFQAKLPRKFKERFIAIDVKAETKRIAEDLKTQSPQQKPRRDKEDE